MLLGGFPAFLIHPLAASVRDEFPDGPDDDYSPMPPAYPRVKPHATIAWSGLRVQAVALSADGSFAATCVEGQKVFKVWDPADGRERITSALHPGPIHALAFYPDGTSIASTLSRGFIGPGDTGDPSSVRISDTKSGQGRRDLHGLDGYVKGLAISTDGLAVAIDTHEIVRAWKVMDGAEIYTLKGPMNRRHGGGFEAVQCGFNISADGYRAASLSTDASMSTDAAVEGEVHPNHTVNLWDFHLGTCRVLNAKSGPLRSVALSPDGSRVLLASTDQHIMAFDFVSGRRVFSFYPSKAGGGVGPYLLAFSPDGTRFVIGKKDGVLRMYKSMEGRHVDTIRGPRTFIRAVAFLPDRLRVLSGGYAETGAKRRAGEAATMNYEPLWVWDAVYLRSTAGIDGFRQPRS